MTNLQLALALVAFAAGGVISALVLIAVGIHAEDRRMSLRAAPSSPAQAAIRRLAGLWSQEPTRTDDQAER